MKIIAATNNKKKLEEIKAILSPLGYEILSLSDAGITHETVEDKETFYENAYKKAYEIYKISKMPTVADDSGLCVDALGGAPGVYSARYAGENAGSRECIDKLLKEMSGVKERSAKFVSSVVMCVDDNNTYSAKGEVFGEITEELYGNRGFGYDPVFFSYELKKTFAEATDEEKNAISHRGKALMKLSQMLKP